jgi:hypothetical protein
MSVKRAFRTGVALGSLLIAGAARSDSGNAVSPSPIDYPSHVYWGDTHLHTKMSLDANMAGNKDVGPEEAMRFARGEAVRASNGMIARMRRPLDFVVIADHTENLGLVDSLRHKDPALLEAKGGKALYEDFEAATKLAPESSIDQAVLDFLHKLWPHEWRRTIDDPRYVRSIWRRVVDTVDRFNQPGVFTAFSGFEWASPGTPNVRFGNLHRIVVFKDGAEKTGQIVPFSFFDSRNPEDLWAYFASYEQKTNGEVLAITHNGNLSFGEMFAPVDFDGKALTRDYIEKRSRWEPLYEVTQIKGTSETHPVLSPNDEFADFEIWNSWGGRTDKDVGSPGWKQRKAGDYARSGLKLGLDQQAKFGVNPFKFGFIGSTDAHTGLATADDDNFWGKARNGEPGPKRLMSPWFLGDAVLNWETSASGYAGIWATANTREALFAAMKRKETYATTGPRMDVRFFGGWDYAAGDAHRSDLARVGYAKGVPMGGDLTAAPRGKAPRFLIRAVKDPDGANLDRVQVIKGWRSADGQLHEKIFDVALSNGRRAGAKAEVRPVRSTVDASNASYTNGVGDPTLAVVWTDPQFRAEELAFYYVRVIEIPTPRWTAYDAKIFALKNLPRNIPMTTQERAYTSPIWYTPPGKVAQRTGSKNNQVTADAR